MLDYKGRAHTTEINILSQPIPTSNGLALSNSLPQDNAPIIDRSHEEQSRHLSATQNILITITKKASATRTSIIEYVMTGPKKT